MESATLTIENLTKIYSGNKVANNNLNVGLTSGEVTAVIGHNGAGKTTLLQLISGSLRPSNGAIYYQGNKISKNPNESRKLVSSMPQLSAPLTGITIKQAITSIAMIKGLNRRDAIRQAEEIIKILRLEKWENTAGEKLSGGLRRLTSFAMAVVCPSPIIILDEPTNDVDPIRRNLMWKYIRKLSKDNKIIIVVSHNLLEVEKNADRIIVMNKGEIIKYFKQKDKTFENQNHLLVLHNIEQSNLDLFSKYKLIEYIEEEQRATLSLKSYQILEAINQVLDLVQEDQIIDYELKLEGLDEKYRRILSV